MDELKFPQPSSLVPITIYYKQECDFSNNAILALQSYRIDKDTPILSAMYDAEALMRTFGLSKEQFFKKINGLPSTHRKFPICFRHTKFLGDSDALLSFLNGS